MYLILYFTPSWRGSHALTFTPEAKTPRRFSHPRSSSKFPRGHVGFFPGEIPARIFGSVPFPNSCRRKGVRKFGGRKISRAKTVCKNPAWKNSRANFLRRVRGETSPRENWKFSVAPGNSDGWKTGRIAFRTQNFGWKKKFARERGGKIRKKRRENGFPVRKKKGVFGALFPGVFRVLEQDFDSKKGPKTREGGILINT